MFSKQHRVIRILTLVFALTAGRAAAPDGQGESPFDFSTFKGRVEFFHTLMGRHGNLALGNLQFHRSLMGALDHFLVTHASLGDEAAPLWQPEVIRATGKYSSRPFEFDHAALESLRKQLTQDVEILRKEHAINLTIDLTEQLAQLRTGANRETILAWLRLAPHIYDGEGKPTNKLNSIKVRIQRLTVNELDNLYQDLWREHLLKKLKTYADTQKDVLSLLNANDREFIEKRVKPAITAKAVDGGSTSMRLMSLEELPAVVALFRGYFGGDCSILSVPDYPALKQVRVFLIRKSNSFGGKPDGYVLTVNVNVKGRTIPYVLTVNGASLNADDVAASLNMVAQIGGVSELIVPQYNVVGTFVNTESAVAGMTSRHPTEIRVPLPAGWSNISESRESNGYSDYYASQYIEAGHLTLVKDLIPTNFASFRIGTAANPYVKLVNGDNVLLKDRAIMAANLAFGSKDPAERRAIARHLKVTVKQLKVAEALNSQAGIPYKSFVALKKEIGFLLTDIGKLSVEAQIRTLYDIGKNAPELAASEQWQTLMRSASDKLDKQVAETLKSQGEHELWQILNFYLPLKNYVPDSLRHFPESLVETLFQIKGFPDDTNAGEWALQMAPYTSYPLYPWLDKIVSGIPTAGSAENKRRYYFTVVKLLGRPRPLTEGDKILISKAEDRIVELLNSNENLFEYDNDSDLQLMFYIDRYANLNPTFAKRLIENRLKEVSLRHGYYDPPRMILTMLEERSDDHRLQSYMQEQYLSLEDCVFKNSRSAASALSIMKSSKLPWMQKMYQEILARVQDRMIRFYYLPDMRAFPNLFKIFPELKESPALIDKLTDVIKKWKAQPADYFSEDALLAIEALLASGVTAKPMQRALDKYIRSQDLDPKVVKRARQAQRVLRQLEAKGCKRLGAEPSQT